MLLNEGRDRLPEFATGHAVAARLFVDQGLMEEGELAARRVLELDEENVLALRLLADVLENRGSVEEAKSVLERLHVLEPSEKPEREPELEEEPVADVAALAPDEPEPEVAAEEPVVDIAALAPDEPEPVVVEEEPVVDVVALAPDEPEVPEEGATLDEGPLVTRTMADLYARQGLTGRALAVYHELLEASPYDAELQQRVASLEATIREEGRALGMSFAESEPEPSWDSEPAESVAFVEPTGDVADAGDASQAPPISSYFQRLLSWRGEGGASDDEGSVTSPEGGAGPT